MRPLILVTNDDGIESPGLQAAAEAVVDLGDLLIVAPVRQQTSMSRSRPVGPLIGIIEQGTVILRGETYPTYAVHGSPAECVSHAVLELGARKPDICISGINYGENLGASITRSGTVGAALEANSFGIPSLAISAEVDIDSQHADSYAVNNWQIASYFTHRMAEWLLGHSLPQEISVLNINVPSEATERTSLRLTRQSHQNYYEEDVPPKRNYSEGYCFTSSIRFNKASLEPQSDIYAFAIDRVVSITPLSLDLTAKLSEDQWNIGIEQGKE